MFLYKSFLNEEVSASNLPSKVDNCLCYSTSIQESFDLTCSDFFENLGYLKVQVSQVESSLGIVSVSSSSNYSFSNIVATKGLSKPSSPQDRLVLVSISYNPCLVLTATLSLHAACEYGKETLC